MAYEKGKGGNITARTVTGITLELTGEQKAAIQHFWNETGSLGTIDIQVEVVNDRIAPASIQVGTAK
jgi:hypothetical protein